MAMPMQEDVGQEIYTRDHGIVKVDKNTWQDGRFHVVLCPNGAYQHINGLPIKNEGELVEAFGGEEGSNTEALAKALNWFRNRHDQEGKAPRPIGMHPDGYPVFDDGTVPDFDDLYAYFRPGRGLTGMIVALQDYKDRIGGAPKELRQAAAPKLEVLAPVDPAPIEAAPVPSPAELARIEALKAKERIRQAKIRTARKTAQAKAAKAAAKAPAQG